MHSSLDAGLVRPAVIACRQGQEGCVLDCYSMPHVVASVNKNLEAAKGGRQGQQLCSQGLA